MRFSLLFFLAFASSMTSVHSFRVTLALAFEIFRKGNTSKPVAGTAAALIKHFGALDKDGKFSPSTGGLSTNKDPKLLPGVTAKAKIYQIDTEKITNTNFKVIDDGSKSNPGHVTIALKEAMTPDTVLKQLNLLEWTGPMLMADVLGKTQDNKPEKGQGSQHGNTQVISQVKKQDMHVQDKTHDNKGKGTGSSPKGKETGGSPKGKSRRSMPPSGRENMMRAMAEKRSHAAA